MLRHVVAKRRDPRTGLWYAEAWLELRLPGRRLRFWRRRVRIAPSPYD